MEDIRLGEGKIYGAELLKDLLKLLPDAEEVCACLSVWPSTKKPMTRHIHVENKGACSASSASVLPTDQETSGFQRRPGQADTGRFLYVPPNPGASVGGFQACAHSTVSVNGKSEVTCLIVSQTMKSLLCRECTVHQEKFAFHGNTPTHTHAHRHCESIQT